MANYFHWDVETSTIVVSAGTITPVYAGGGARSTAQAKSPTHSLICTPTAPDNGNDPNGVSQTGPDDLAVGYSWPPLNGRSLYYRFWAKFMTGFSWGDGTGAQKVKIARTGINNPAAPGGGLIYTMYMNDGGFDLSEGYWAGTDSAIMVGGDHFAEVSVPGGMIAYADSTWHEYVIRVKPNTTATSYNGEFQVWIDGVSVGSYNSYLLVSNLPNDGGTPNWVSLYGTENFRENWSCAMLAPYWQISGSSSIGGGTVYVDDFSVDDTFNSTFSSSPTASIGWLHP